MSDWSQLANSAVLAVAKLPIGVAGSVSALIFGGATAVRLSPLIEGELQIFIGWTGGIALAIGLLIAVASGYLGLVAQLRRLPARP